MSIASRINEIGVHLTKDWRSIEALTGEAEVDKNIENIATVLDNLWEEMPKVTGTGTSLSLNTKKGKMKVNLLGNTSQTGTPTPSSPIPVNVVSGDNTINVTGKNLLNNTSGITETISGVTFTKNDDGTITANGTATAGIVYYINGFNWQILPAGTYVLSDSVASGESSTTYFTYVDEESDSYLYLSTAAVTTRTYTSSPKLRARIVVRNGVTLNNVVFKPMIEVGSTATTYEPYTSTSYPIHLGVENLFDKDNANIINGYFTPSAPTITSNANHRIIYIPIQPNTAYTIQKSNAGGDKARFGIGTTTITPESGVAVNQVVLENGYTKQTITTNSSANYLVVWCYFTDNTSITESELLATIQIEKGSKANSYSEYGTTPIKMRGIGTYEDYFTKNTGKNKLAPTTNEINETISGVKREGKNGIYTISGTASASGGGNVKYALTNAYTIQNGDYLHLCNTSTTYNASFILFDDNDTQINDYSINAVNRIIDLSTYAGKVIKSIGLYNNSSFSGNITLSPMILNNVSSTTGFEPFGKDMWCKYNAIGSIILDGSETEWALAGSNNYYYLNNDIFPLSAGTGGQIYPAYSNYYISGKYNNIYGATVDYGFAFSYNSHRIVIRNKDITSTDDFTTWLTTHNTQVDFALTMPYLELITNNTLKSQLDIIEKALAKSGQTNISQVNNDAPFKIYASALRDLSSLGGE